MELKVDLGKDSYSVIVQKEILNSLGTLVKEIYSGEKVHIITDDNVDSFYGEKVLLELQGVGFKVSKSVIPHGESSKNLKMAQVLFKDLIEWKIGRKDIILTLGGGVVGDLGGFVASTYLRGIDFIQFPTSLLAQIDSSVGGKVAVDLPQGKNLVGSFYQPKIVIIDPSTLYTLEDRYIVDGLGELVKYSMIFDKEILNKLRGLDFKLKSSIEEVSKIIYRCCELKGKIVEEDEKECGKRGILNFGHTIGHAIEKIEKYRGYSHGEAIAIGMNIITSGAEELGLTDKGTKEILKSNLISLGLPTMVNISYQDEIFKCICYDKKVEGDYINLSLIKNIGNGYLKKMSFKEVENIIREGFIHG